MDFRLRVFKSVAENLSFTKAAKELYISQPAISKHINELEQLYKVMLFERKGGKITLTHEGDVFLRHVRAILDSYGELAYDMELMSGSFSGEIKIGASTTIAQYLISPLLANFISRFPNIKVVLETGNSNLIENMLEEQKIDVGLVEGGTRRTNLRYSRFAKDELVLVTSSSNRCKESAYFCEDSALRDGINPKDVLLLDSIPLILRESGSGTLDVIERELAKNSLRLQDLNVLLHIGSTEGIKQFLQSNKSSYAILSVISLLNELKSNQLKIVDLYGGDIEREFSFVTRQGGNHERVEKFINFANYWYSSNML